MRQAGPRRTHSSDFILWTWTLRCSRPSAARLISHRTGTRRYGGVVLMFPIAVKLTQQRDQWAYMIGHVSDPVTLITAGILTDTRPAKWRWMVAMWSARLCQFKCVFLYSG